MIANETTIQQGFDMLLEEIKYYNVYRYGVCVQVSHALFYITECKSASVSIKCFIFRCL